MYTYLGYQENRSQYREEEHDRHSYQQSQSNHFQRDTQNLSPLQQFHMLPSSNDENDNQYFKSEAQLDWKSLSQKVCIFLFVWFISIVCYNPAIFSDSIQVNIIVITSSAALKGLALKYRLSFTPERLIFCSLPLMSNP
jgi:hypothetical protein